MLCQVGYWELLLCIKVLDEQAESLWDHVTVSVPVDGGASGPAAAERGSSQRQRAVGEGE